MSAGRAGGRTRPHDPGHAKTPATDEVPESAEILVVVLARCGVLGRIDILLRRLLLMAPLAERRVSLNEMHSDAFPMGGGTVPRAHLRRTAERFLAEAADVRGGHDPLDSARGGRHRSSWIGTSATDL